MTWLIGCPKSEGALINHPADWIQSSASPAQWWTGKDTAQVLTRVHCHHCRAARQKNEGTHTDERGLLFLCHSQCQAANRWMTGGTSSGPYNYKGEGGEREQWQEVHVKEKGWWTVAWYLSIQGGQENDAGVNPGWGLYMHEDPDTQLHTHTLKDMHPSFFLMHQHPPVRILPRVLWMGDKNSENYFISSNWSLCCTSMSSKQWYILLLATNFKFICCLESMISLQTKRWF